MMRHLAQKARRRALATARRVPGVIEQHYVDELEEADGDDTKIKQAFRKMCIAQIIFFHVSPALAGLGQVGLGQVGLGQGALAQVARAQAGPGPGQAGPAQVGPGQAGPGQAGPAQAGPAQVGPGQVGPGQAGPDQGGPGQVGPVRAPVLDIAAETERQVELVHAARSPVELIARDQVLKFAAVLNRTLLEAQSPEYIWVTARDERVRPMHRVLDGQTFRWDSPPVTNPQGERNSPGEDYCCRCVPVATT